MKKEAENAKIVKEAALKAKVEAGKLAAKVVVARVEFTPKLQKVKD